MVKNKEITKKKRSSALLGDEPIAKRLRHSTRTSFGNMLESFINNPGLQHIAEKIFQNFDNPASLLKLRLVNSSWKRILDRPMFWPRWFWHRNLKSDLSFSFLDLASNIQKLDPDNYEEQKNYALRMIKLSILETRRSENSVGIKKIMEETKLLKKKQKTAMENQIRTNEIMIKLIMNLIVPTNLKKKIFSK